ncbi:hypothetical protein E4U42_001749, partial [Claviceps africana]
RAPEVEEGEPGGSSRGARRLRLRLRLRFRFRLRLRLRAREGGPVPRGAARRQAAQGKGQGRAAPGGPRHGAAVLFGNGRRQAPLREQPAHVPRGVEKVHHDGKLLLLARLRRGQEPRARHVPPGQAGQGAGAVPLPGRTTVLSRPLRRAGPAVLGQERSTHRHDGAVQGQRARHCARGRSDARLSSRRGSPARPSHQRRRRRRRRGPRLVRVGLLGRVETRGRPGRQVRRCRLRRFQGLQAGDAHLGVDHLQPAPPQVGQEEHVDLRRRHLVPALRRHQGLGRLPALLLPPGQPHLRRRAHQDQERPAQLPVAPERALQTPREQLPGLCQEPQARGRRHVPREHLQELHHPRRPRDVPQDEEEGQGADGQAGPRQGQGPRARRRQEEGRGAEGQEPERGQGEGGSAAGEGGRAEEEGRAGSRRTGHGDDQVVARAGWAWRM